MSADNGVYIVKFPDGYRVAECQAIENIDFYPKGSKERKETLKDYFRKSKVFKTEREALLYAWNKYEAPTEYGIQYLGEYESYKQRKEREVKDERE